MPHELETYQLITEQARRQTTKKITVVKLRKTKWREWKTTHPVKIQK